MNPAQVPNSEDFPSSLIPYHDNNTFIASNLEQAAESSTESREELYLMIPASQTSENGMVYDDQCWQLDQLDLIKLRHNLNWTMNLICPIVQSK